MAFIFSAGVNPKKPIETGDLPPHGWAAVSSYEFCLDFVGPISPISIQCLLWNWRESERKRKRVNQALMVQQLQL